VVVEIFVGDKIFSIKIGFCGTKYKTSSFFYFMEVVMKKSMIFAVILAILLFVGCGSDKKGEKTAGTGDTAADTGSSNSGENGASPDDVDTDTDDDPCRLDDSLLAASENGGEYFAFKGVGIINADIINNPEPADHTKVSFGFSDIGGKQFFQGEQNTFFVEYEQGINARIFADGNKDYEWRTTTDVYFTVPLQYIDTMKANGVYTIDVAPETLIFDTAFSEDFSTKRCLIAANKYSNASENGEKNALGKTQVCYGKNENFAAGETFKLAMRAELTLDKEELAAIYDLATADDLCECLDSGGDLIDCKTVKWSDDTYNACHTIDDNTWSPLSSGTMNWEEAADYCENLSVCGHDDWRLPNIDELRKLVKNCRKIAPEGECRISENDLLSDMEAKEAGAWEGTCEGEWEAECGEGSCVCSGSQYPEVPGYFSEVDDSNIELWSSSSVTDIENSVWTLRFSLSNSVDIVPENTHGAFSVRCVR
jgi:uncharacterized protein (TIGR02145 family)